MTSLVCLFDLVCMGLRERKSRYHKLCARVSAFAEIVEFNYVGGAMTKSHPICTVFLIAVAKTPSKYA